MSVTIKVFADLGVTGLAGTAGFVTYLSDGTTLVQGRSASVSTIAALPVGTGYKGSFTGTDGIDYLVIWDDGAGTPSYTPAAIYNTTPPVNVAQIAGGPARQGDGTASAVASGTITLDAADPQAASNLNGWQVQVLSATTGAGQVGTVSSATTSLTKPLAANWGVTPTGTIVYELIPPAGFSLGANAPAGWLNAAAFAASAIDAAAITSAAVTKIQAGLATPTNITAGTMTTVTNLTNAPTSGDFTAAQKTSLNAATPTVFVAASGLNNVMIETNYNIKQAMKVILAACGNVILGNGTTTVTVGNAALPAPTTGANTVITATMTGVVLVNGVPTAVDRTAVTGVVLSNA